MTEFPDWIKDFKWDSEDQKKSFHAYLYWAKHHGITEQIRPIDLYFMQKQHDSNLYWNEVVSDQVKSLQNEVRNLVQIIDQLRGKNG